MPEAQASTVIETVNDLAVHVAKWHHQKMRQLAHLGEVPEGETLTVDLGNGEKDLVLTGETLEAYKAALVIASDIFSQLPFAAEFEPVEEAANG